MGRVQDAALGDGSLRRATMLSMRVRAEIVTSILSNEDWLSYLNVFGLMFLSTFTTSLLRASS